jgi:phosphomannomutase
MPIKPELNVSGYRGIWGETLNDEIATCFAKAFASFTKEDTKKENPIILIGRDGRESGPEIKKIIIKKLENLGVNAIDGDILPTPTVLFSVHKHKYDGAIIITASHNPIEYNGLKFVNKEALFTTGKEIEKINQYYDHS